MTVVKAHAACADGSIGVRGFRAHCTACGFLSTVRGSYQAANSCLRYHRERKCRARS